MLCAFAGTLRLLALYKCIIIIIIVIIIIIIKPAPAQMIDGTEKPKIPSKFAKRTAQYNEFGSKYLVPSPIMGLQE